jgi:biotin transporter BioY
VVGTIAIYIPGVSILYLNLNFIQQKAVSLGTAMNIGCLVVLPGDLIKIGVVLYFGPLLRQKIQMSKVNLSD